MTIYCGEAAAFFIGHQMSLLPRLRFSKDRENEALRERVTTLQTALQQCADMAGRWTRFQSGVAIVLAFALLVCGFTLGVYRQTIKDAGATLVQAVGLARAPNADAAEEAYRSSEYAKALALAQPLAEAGDARAQSVLGLLYYRGRGVTLNYDEALKWFRSAAAQGDVAAQFYLGFMFS